MPVVRRQPSGVTTNLCEFILGGWQPCWLVPASKPRTCPRGRCKTRTAAGGIFAARAKHASSGRVRICANLAFP